MRTQTLTTPSCNGGAPGSASISQLVSSFALITILGMMTTTSALARGPSAWSGDLEVGDLATLEKFCRKYDRISGKLRVGPDWKEANLEKLSCIQEIGEELVIEGTSELESLRGLERITTPAGVPWRAVRLRDNEKLSDISALSQVKELRYQIVEVTNNPRIETLQIPGEIVSEGIVRINGNAGLTRLVGPQGVEGGSRLKSVIINGNVQLETVEGFNRIAQVSELTITGDPVLSSLNTFGDAREMGDILLRGLPRLAKLGVAPGMEQVRSLVVADMDAVEQLPGWTHLQWAGSVQLTDNERLSDVSGLLTNHTAPPVVDKLVITHNPTLDPARVESLPRRLSTPLSACTIEDNGGGLPAVTP